MRTLVHFIVVLAGLGLAAAAGAQSRSAPIDLQLAEGSRVSFVCRGPEVTHPADGRFSVLMGRLGLDPADLTTVVGRLEVVLSSITTDESEWDEMFRRAPFLTIDEFPRARFEVTRVHGASSLAPNEWVSLTLDGRFTLRGVTREISVPTRVRFVPAGGGRRERLEVRGQFDVKWDDYGVPVPTGHTRTIAGDGVQVTLSLDYERVAPRRGRG